jgi:hypothetical protein
VSSWELEISRGGARPWPYKYSVATVIAIAIVFYTLLISVRTRSERGWLEHAIHAILVE